jgi:transketolase
MRRTALDAIAALAKRDPRVVFIGSDLGAGTLAEMQREFPDRFFMEGIAEAAIVGLAAGLALDGYIPYINTIATFLTRRCYEQVAVDLCLQRLPVRLIASGGGAVYAPLGPTHMALEDIAIMRALPGMTVIAPSDAPEMARVMDASLDVAGPVYVRVAKGGDPISSRPDLPYRIGRAIDLRPGADVLFVGTGIMTTHALRAAELLAADGIDAGVLHMHTIKPFDDAALVAGAARVALVVSVEEHSCVGGLGSAVAEALLDGGSATPLLRLALPDRFMDEYGSQNHILTRAGLQPDAIAASVRARLARVRPYVSH